MPCPHGAQTVTAALPRRTTRGYRTCRCPGCRRSCNERTGTPFAHAQVPTDIVPLVVRSGSRAGDDGRQSAPSHPARKPGLPRG